MNLTLTVETRGASNLSQSDFCGAVTGIGSLPYTNAARAIHAVAAHCAEVPFWPQLPKASPREFIITQALGAFSQLIEPREARYGFQVRSGKLDTLLQALHESNGKLPPQNASGFEAFCDSLSAGNFPAARAVKGQMEGPLTTAAYLFTGDRPFLADRTLFAAVSFHIAQVVSHQVARLRRAGLPVLFFVDEPALCLDLPASSEEDVLGELASVLAVARASGATAGLHCCASQPFRRMCRVKPDILSFDAHENLEAFFQARCVRSFLSTSAIVAYGLVPTWPRPNDVSPATLFARWLNAASAAGDPALIARRSMITTTCGLGLLNESVVEQSFSIQHRLGTLFRGLAERG